MKKKLFLSFALATALLGLSATPAAADSIRLDYRSGGHRDWRPEYRHEYRREHRRDWDDRRWNRHRHRETIVRVMPYAGYETYYTPRVVYAPPPSIIVDPPVITYPTPVVDNSGASCREYQTTIRVGGRTQPAYGTACLQPDGSWQTVD